MKFRSIFLILLSLSICGCCVSHDLTILNQTPNEIILVSGHTKSHVSIEPDHEKIFPHARGSIAVFSGTNIWFYNSINLISLKNYSEKQFRFGICQCGMGYYTTKATIDNDGNLNIGNLSINPIKTVEWNKTEQ